MGFGNKIAENIMLENAKVKMNQCVDTVAQKAKEYNDSVGKDVPLMIDGMIQVKNIPFVAKHRTVTVLSVEEMNALEIGDGADQVQDGDDCRIVVDGEVKDSYTLAGETWIKIAQDFIAESGHCLQADTAENAAKVNGYRIVTMSQTEYENTTKEENTVYLVGDFS